jgi:hypothetical protein
VRQAAGTLVIGGGIVGKACALALCRAGETVLAARSAKPVTPRLLRQRRPHRAGAGRAPGFARRPGLGFPPPVPAGRRPGFSPGRHRRLGALGGALYKGVDPGGGGARQTSPGRPAPGRSTGVAAPGGQPGSSRPAGRARPCRGLGEPGDRSRRSCGLARRRYRPGPAERLVRADEAQIAAIDQGADRRRRAIREYRPGARSGSGPGVAGRGFHRLGRATTGWPGHAAANRRSSDRGPARGWPMVEAGAGAGRRRGWLGGVAARPGSCGAGDRRARLSPRRRRGGLGRPAAGGVRGPLADPHPVRRPAAGRQFRRVRSRILAARSAQMGAAAPPPVPSWDPDGGADHRMDGRSADPARLSSRHRRQPAGRQSLLRLRAPASGPDLGGRDRPSWSRP